MKKRWMVFLLPILAFCSGARRVPFEQYSVAMTLAVEPDSSVFIGTDEKFNGVLWLKQVFETEGTAAASVKLIENFGRFYLCADQFKNVWILQPHKDGVSAKAKAVDVTPEDETDVYTDIGLSRYGSRENAMVRFRFNNRQLFIDRKGGVHETYQ